MQKSVTFNVDAALVEKARAKARAGNLELEEVVRIWLEDYTRDAALAAEAAARPAVTYREVMEKLKHVSTGGRRFTRDEMNER